MIRSRTSDHRTWWQTQAFEAVVLGGLVAGTLGGRAAASGGAATAALGLALGQCLAPFLEPIGPIGVSAGGSSVEHANIDTVASLCSIA